MRNEAFYSPDLSVDVDKDKQKTTGQDAEQSDETQTDIETQ